MMLWEIEKKSEIALLTENTKTTQPKKNETQTKHNRHESMKALRRTNKIIKDHDENRLNVNRMTSSYSNVVKNKKKNIDLFTDSILKTLRMGELNRYIYSGKVYLKSFPCSKANQLNHHTIPILEGINTTLLQSMSTLMMF